MHLKKIGMDLMICKVVSTAETAAFDKLDRNGAERRRNIN